MKDCVVLAGDARDAAAAADWAAAFATKARLTSAEARALAARVRDRYVEACAALFGGAAEPRKVLLSGRVENGGPAFELCTDGAVKCDVDCQALGPRPDKAACDGLTCFTLAT